MAVNIVSETPDRLITTPNGVVNPLAGPSRGSHQLSTWRIRMEPGSSSPEHMIDRDQVWMPVAGGFEVTVDGEIADLLPGQAVVIPAGLLRQVRTTRTHGEALVCMTPGGRASVPGKEGTAPLPWAE